MLELEATATSHLEPKEQQAIIPPQSKHVRRALEHLESHVSPHFRLEDGVS